MDINIIETNIIEKLKQLQIKIIDNKKKILSAKFDFEKNYLNKIIISDEKLLKDFICKAEERITYYVCLNLYKNLNNHNHNNNCNCNYNKFNNNIEQYNYLIRWSKYKNCSEFFLSKGIYAGVYLDMLEIMKCPNDINIECKQIYKEHSIINNICKLFVKNQYPNEINEINNIKNKYSFLNFLFKLLNYSDMTNFIFESIKYININNINKQIGYKKIKNTQTIVYYLRYGLPNNISYNIGMKSITNKYKYAITFMSKIQSEIYIKNGNQITIKDQSFILIPINKDKDKDKYEISCEYSEFIKNEINNYIYKNNKLNYEIVYIIDILKLYNYYSENNEYHNIQQNDIGLILVHKNIPINCVIEITTKNCINL
jgi:hypothetical protein